MRWKKRRPNYIRFAHLLLAFISKRFAEWPMSMIVHWKHVLNLKLKGEVQNWSFWIKKVSNVFYQFSFPIQYFANFWIIHNALRSVSCSSYLYLSRHKSSKKKKLVSIIRPRGLLHCQKKGVNSRTFFLVTKFGFVIQFSFFLFHPKWVDKVNLYGPKIKKGTISRVARRGNTPLFGQGGYVFLGYCF